ncbi:lytic transglycosylase domain-containing protein [Paraburkholderia lacunae]|uniref:Lytic transglycosylase n=1 Tax=Paraburkholderia lacunae TaxID=2211104 RepID=A0A370N936_9BURK|nr:lytic transglycosylase domain-containing protein [Paraburkholderia lacunae]RDK02113.1 lytic transglycosylase [Paraburkholderia lacunae]
MQRNSALDGVQAQREIKLHPLTGLKILLATIAFSYAAISHAADAPAPAAMPLSASNAGVGANAVVEANAATGANAVVESNVPALSDITAVLRAQFRVAPSDSARIARAVLVEADRHAISPILLLAVMSVESSFNRFAVSIAGARGLMQILPAAHPQLIAGTSDLSDPAINVRIGSAILRDYLDRSGGDLEAAWLRYSGGGRGYAQRVVLRMQRFDASLRRE